MRISVIAFGVCFPVLVNTVEGVRAVSPEARDTASMLHVGPARSGSSASTFRPRSLRSSPGFGSHSRSASSLVVLSEFVGEEDGLGCYIRLQQSQFNVPGDVRGILFLGLLGYVLNRLFLVAERHVLAWHYGAAGDVGPLSRRCSQTLARPSAGRSLRVSGLGKRYSEEGRRP